MKRSRRLCLVIVAALVAAFLMGALFLRPGRSTTPPRFVGRESCVDCHREQHDQWRGSHHDLAMQPATPATVLGDFNDRQFNDGIVTTRLRTQADRFHVQTEGPDGKLTEFQIKYTFGVEPLQQYLVDFPDGRKQAMTIAWDSKDHRWFSLYPGRSVGPEDWLHWTQRGQNWNSNCAECHSTNLRKNYGLSTDSFTTVWSEINVSCEACHGPGSRHVEWANTSAFSRWWKRYRDDDHGLVLRLRDPNRTWGFNAEGQPALITTSQPDPSIQVEMCAQCHSRRGPVSVQYRHGDDLLDHYMPQLLQENIYHPDGQILDEVYEYGSFVQSKMYHHGVRCTDCHNPHSGRLLATGNTLCLRCHLAPKYDSPQHHFHQPGSTGSACVECHMPSRTYMVVDPRRDHSLRVPRPDLSLKLRTPNACTQCHTEKSIDWASEVVDKWYGVKVRPEHYGSIFAAAWAGDRQAAGGLREMLLDTDRPAFVRASAASALQGYPFPETDAAASKVLGDRDPLVRAMSAALLSGLPPDQRIERLTSLLSDPVRAVRHIAARSLLDVRANLSEKQGRTLDTTLADQTTAMTAHADNVGGRMALGELYQQLGRTDEAMRAHMAAAAMDPQNIDAQMALAELYIRLNRDRDAEALLTRMLELPKPPELPNHMWDRAHGTVEYQLGLLIASSQSRWAEGLAHIERAANLLPNIARLHFHMGELFRSLDRHQDAERAYLKAVQLDGRDPQALHGLVTLYIQLEQWSRAESYVRRLADILPQDPEVQRLREEIRRRLAAP